MNELNLQLKKSRLFLQEQKSVLNLNIPLTIIIYFLLWIMGLLIGRFIATFALGIFEFIIHDNDSILIALRKMIVCGTQITVFFLWVKMIEKRPVSSIGIKTVKPFKSYMIGLLIGLCSITLIAAFLFFFGVVTFQYDYVNSISIINICIIAFGWIVQSASEEIAIRGWLIPSIGNRSNPIAAISITAVIFGILHLFSSGVTVLSFLNLILSGIFFAGYAIRNGSIWGVCGLHFAWNFALGNIYGFPVSGFSSNGDTILTIQKMDSNMLTGGEFGPEGGIAATMILLMAICILALSRQTTSEVIKGETDDR